MDFCGPQATENRASRSRAGAGGSRVPGPWGCGAGRGRSWARTPPLTGSCGPLRAGATVRSTWGLERGVCGRAGCPSAGAALPLGGQRLGGGPWELPKSWASRANETGSREKLSLIRLQAERDSNQGSRGNFTPNEADSGGFISLPHSAQRRLIRHLLCARLERAWHCRSAQFLRAAPRQGSWGGQRVQNRGESTLQGGGTLPGTKVTSPGGSRRPW